MKASVLRRDAARLAKTVLAAFLMAVITNVFLKTAQLVPGGVNGLSLLSQRVFHDFFHLDVSYTAINLTLNSIPAAIALFMVGKKFVILSVLMVVLNSIFIDLLPTYVFTQDMLLITVFGGMAYGFSISIALNANASSGGTDFIAMAFSNKYNIALWNYFLAFNAMIIFTAGSLYGFDRAMYSIIFQFFSTYMVNHLHRRYQRKTIFIVSKDPDHLAEALMRETNHGVTAFEGKGCYSGKPRTMLYMVVSKSDLRQIRQILKRVDPTAFMNVADSQSLSGNFYLEPMD